MAAASAVLANNLGWSNLEEVARLARNGANNDYQVQLLVHPQNLHEASNSVHA